MELDKLKGDWEKATDQIIKQPILTSKLIDQMTQTKYQFAINKIKYPEVIGGIVCLVGLSFVGLNFNKLNTSFLQGVGVITILLLLILPVLSFLSLSQFSSAGSFDKPHVEMLKQFACQKLRFLKYQKVNAFLCYLLLVAVIILLPKLFYGKDISFSRSFWLFAFSFGYIFLLVSSRWVQKFYSHSLKQAEELLKESRS